MATTKTNVSFDKEKVLKIIALSLLGVGVLLALIGCFGDVYKIVLNNGAIRISQSYSISYFFKEAWDLLKNYKQISSSMHGIALFEVLIHLFSFITVIVTVLVTTIMLIMRTSKNNLLEIDVKKTSTNLLVGALPYVIITKFVSAFIAIADDGSRLMNEFVNYGWGPILIIVSLFVLVASSCLYQMSKESNANSMVKVGLEHLTLVFLGFIAIFGFGNALKFSMNVSGVNETGEISIFFVIENYFAYISQQGAPEMSSSVITCSIIAMLIMLVMIAITVFVMKEKDDKKKIELLSCFVIASIAAGILAMISLNGYFNSFEYYYEPNVQFASAFIVDIILGVLAITSTAVSLGLDKNKTVAKTTK